MKNNRKFLYPLAALLLTIVLAACAGNRTIEDFEVVRQDGESTAIELAAIGDTIQLAGRVTFDNQTIDSVVPGLIDWTSSDDSVATVENGLVTAVGFGTASITGQHKGHSDSVTVAVVAPE